MLRLGVVVYWALNAGLIVAEARWHLLYRLTVWDLSQLKPYAPMLGKLFHS
jgi:hypothetical protein